MICDKILLPYMTIAHGQVSNFDFTGFVFTPSVHIGGADHAYPKIDEGVKMTAEPELFRFRL